VRSGEQGAGSREQPQAAYSPPGRACHASAWGRGWVERLRGRWSDGEICL